MSRLVLCLSLAALTLAACRSERTEDVPPPPEPALPVSAEVVNRIGLDAIEKGIVGLSIGIAVDGEVVYSAGFGHLDLERTRPASADSIYDIASVGKQFTAAAVLQLAEADRLSLDQSIRELVPETPDNFPDATLLQLLQHTSGFDDGPTDEQNPPEGWDEPRSGLELLEDPGLVAGTTRFEPGETWNYSNSGFLLLGLAVERAAGRPYDEYVKERLLASVDPTMLVGADAPEGGSGSFLLADGELRSVAPVHLSRYGGAGSIRSSVLGLLAWQLALDEGRILRPASLNTMRSPSTVRGDHGTALMPYGTGIRLGTLGSHAKFGHTGSFDGGSAVLARYPDDGLTIAVLANTGRGDVPHALDVEARIARIVLDEPLPAEVPPSLPVSPEEVQRLQGRYCRSSCYDASFENGELVTRRAGQVIERLVHTGNLQFQQVDSLGNEEWFLADGDRAGWWLLERDGFLWDVLRRE